jgi:dolichyl-phosphate beta-glucosyltransferase
VTPSSVVLARELEAPGWVEHARAAAALRGVARPYLSVVVPVWNGGLRLGRTLATLQALLARQSFSSELIVVDDGSDALTQRVIDHARNDGPLTALRNERNRGKGYSVARGILAARGARRLFTDADLPYPGEIEDVVEALDSGYDLAVACRAHRDSRYIVNADAVPRLLARRVMSRGFNVLARGVLIKGIPDTQAGLKGFTAAAAELIFNRVTIQRFGFDLECLYIAQRFHLRVAQLPVTYCADSGASTVGCVTDSVRMLRDLGMVRVNAWRGRYG